MTEQNQSKLNSKTAIIVVNLIAKAMGCGKTVRRKYARYNGNKIPKDYLSKKKNGKNIFTLLTKKTLGAIMYTALDINDFDRKSNIKLGSTFLDIKTFEYTKSEDKPYEEIVTAKHLVTRCKYVVNLLNVLQYICNLPKRYHVLNSSLYYTEKHKNIESLKLKPFRFRNISQAQVLDYMINNQNLALQFWQRISIKPKSDESKMAVNSYIDTANKGQLADVYIDDYYCRLFLYTFFMNYFKMINNKIDFSKAAGELFVKIISTQPFYDKIYKKNDNSISKQCMSVLSYAEENNELLEDKENHYIQQFYATNDRFLHFLISSSANTKNENVFLSSLCEFVGSAINKNSLEDIENIIECSFNNQTPYLKELKDIASSDYIGKLFLDFLIAEGIISFEYNKKSVIGNLVEKFNKFCLEIDKRKVEYEEMYSNSSFNSWK